MKDLENQIFSRIKIESVVDIEKPLKEGISLNNKRTNCAKSKCTSHKKVLHQALKWLKIQLILKSIDFIIHHVIIT